jgi:hypothetical protein
MGTSPLGLMMNGYSAESNRKSKQRWNRRQPGEQRMETLLIPRKDAKHAKKRGIEPAITPINTPTNRTKSMIQKRIEQEGAVRQRQKAF